jgi:ELWxxDGT repeat protein
MRHLLSADFTLVRDLNTRVFANHSDPSEYVSVNSTIFFATSLGLVRTDGTVAGTKLIKTLSDPADLTNVAGTLYFTATDLTDNVANGRELWKSDGTAAGTVMVKDIRPNIDSGNPSTDDGPGGSNPSELTNVGGVLYFTADDQANGRELWKSNGTTAGTVMVRDIFGGRHLEDHREHPWFPVIVDVPNSSFPSSLINFNGTLYFAATDGTNGRELWKSDGTSAGTLLVKDVFSGTHVGSVLQPTGDYLPENLPNSSSPENLSLINGTLYFSANDGSSGVELWKSDGSTAGTTLVSRIPVASSPRSYPRNFTNVSGSLYFVLHKNIDSNFTSELWKSNGTSAGTVMVKGAFRTGFYAPKLLTNVNGVLFFAASNRNTGTDLWKSNGTAAGTVIVKDIVGGDNGTRVSELTNVNGMLYFVAEDTTSLFTEKLWRSDGTTAGTVIASDIFAGRKVTTHQGLANINGSLYFSADNGTNGRELWKSNGTAVGTVMFNVNPESTYSSVPENFVDVNGVLYFTADDGVRGRELWKTNGTSAGTVLVRDIVNGYSYPRDLTNVNGVLYFTADDGVRGRELWKTNGTTAGTVLVRDVRSGTGGSDLRNLTNVNGVLYFTADDGINGSELWKSDGTSTGTVMVKNIVSGNVGSSPGYLTNHAGVLYFTANNTELWKSNGTLAGTVLVRNTGSRVRVKASDANGTLYFLANAVSNDDQQLWKSNGTAAGTVLVKSLGVPFAGQGLREIVSVGGTLYFPAYSERDGEELWKSNGTSTGTVPVKDIFPGSYKRPVDFDPDPNLYEWEPNSSAPTSLINFGGTLYFIASDKGSFTTLSGRTDSLWKTNGTAAGTVKIAEIGRYYGLAGSRVFGFLGNRMFAPILSAAYGVELHSTDLTKGTSGNDRFTLKYTGQWPSSLVTVTLSTNGGPESRLGTFSTSLPLSIDGLGGTDTVRIEGTTGRDIFTVNSSGLWVYNHRIHLNSIENRTLAGLSGDDEYRFDADATLGVFTLDESAGGSDTLSFAETSTRGVNVNLGVATRQVVNSNLSLILGSAATFENIIGGASGDKLSGNALNNMLQGNKGHDVLAGGGGNDTYSFTAASASENDVISDNSLSGVDTISFSSLTNNVSINLGLTSAVNFQRLDANRFLRLDSGAKIENVIGGFGNDTIIGNALGNILNGGPGNDNLTGVTGADTLIGGHGNDTYSFRAAASPENNIISEVGTNGVDTISFSALTSNVTINLGLAGFQRLDAFRFLRLDGTSAFENIIGGSGNDTIVGNSLNNVLQGNGGHDILVGNSGNDQLLGGAGRDLLIGGLGRDRLDAGTDDDILIAGRTINDNLIGNLQKLRTDWISQLSYVSRVTRLRAGVGLPVVSLKAKLNVLNDAGDDDSLAGGTGSDWYLRALDDAITGLATGELIDLL